MAKSNGKEMWDKGEYIRESVHLTRAPRMKSAVMKAKSKNVKKSPK